MRKRFEFKYVNSDIGFCQTYYSRERYNSASEVITSRYCIITPEGAHTLSDWDEPLSAFNTDILKNCFFQTVPTDDPLSNDVNAWIKTHTGGLLPDEHEFTIHPYTPRQAK